MSAALEVLKKLGMEDGADAVQFIASRFQKLSNRKVPYGAGSGPSDEVAAHLYPLADTLDNYELSAGSKAMLSDPDSAVEINHAKAREIYDAFEQMGGNEPAFKSNLFNAARITSAADREQRAGYIASRAQRKLTAEENQKATEQYRLNNPEHPTPATPQSPAPSPTPVAAPAPAATTPAPTATPAPTPAPAATTPAPTAAPPTTSAAATTPAATTTSPAAPPTPAAATTSASTTSAPAAATPSPATPAPAQKSGFFSGFGIGAGRTGAQVAQETDEYSNRVLKGIGLGAKDADAALVKEAKAYMSSADAKFVDDSTLSPQQKAVLSQTRDSFYKSGTMYSDDAIGAMGSNFASTGNVFGGLSAATETTSGNALLRSVQEGGVMGVALMGGALGAAGGMLAGGDASEGAMIGAALGAGVGGVSRAITKSAPEIEAAMMERLLGKEVMEGFKTSADGNAVAANEVRGQALAAINKMSDEEVGKISGGRAMQKRLTSNKEDSLLTQTRTLTMAGAFLGGVAFTSKKNDHRRGFNKNRGNRI